MRFLREQGLNRLDLLLLSHSGSDHAGGQFSVEQAFEVGRLISGEPHKTGGDECYAGQIWQWDEVAFRILHPPQGFQGEGNNRSCVLLI